MFDPFAFLRILLTLAVVGGVIVLPVVLLTKRKNNILPDAPDTGKQAEVSSSSSGTATIFVNGGAPSSGNKMGTLTVDGKSISLLYTDAPIEITVPTGRHHVVVEGGIAGDARIDRVVELDILDVWTIDMPGAGDADVIRHQMIGYSEYRNALSDAGFHVTKKSL